MHKTSRLVSNQIRSSNFPSERNWIIVISMTFDHCPPRSPGMQEEDLMKIKKLYFILISKKDLGL